MVLHSVCLLATLFSVGLLRTAPLLQGGSQALHNPPHRARSPLEADPKSCFTDWLPLLRSPAPRLPAAALMGRRSRLLKFAGANMRTMIFPKT